MARALEVSGSAYYRWLRGGERGPRAKARAKLDSLLKAAFERSKGRYGAPRNTRHLNDSGYSCNEKTVASSLRRTGSAGQGGETLQGHDELQSHTAGGRERARAGLLHERAKPEVGRRHQLSVDQRRLGLPGGHCGPAFASGHRLGEGQDHDSPARLRRASDGALAAKDANRCHRPHRIARANTARTATNACCASTD